MVPCIEVGYASVSGTSKHAEPGAWSAGTQASLHCWRRSRIALELSIVAGEQRAESPVAEREKERECRTGVSQNAGWKRANCDAIDCMRCRAPFIGPHAAACAGAQLPMLLPATVEFYFAGEPAESLPLLLQQCRLEGPFCTIGARLRVYTPYQTWLENIR